MADRWLRNHREVHKLEQRALELALKETQRRLNELNHAHEQMVARDTNYVLDDAWSTANANMLEKIDLVTLGLARLDERQSTSRYSWGNVLAVLSVLASGGAVIVVVLIH